MNEHEFTLVIEGELTDGRLDALYEAGCDDATFSTATDRSYGEFRREAESLQGANISAIGEVDGVEGLEVLRVEPDDLVWASEIAERTGRTRQSVDLLIKSQRGPGGFPEPATHATRNPLWRWSDVEAFAYYEGREPETEHAAILEAINGALQARHGMRRSALNASLRTALTELIASQARGI